MFEVPECLASRSRSGWCHPHPLSYPDVGYIPVYRQSWRRAVISRPSLSSALGRAAIGLWDMGFAAGGELMVEHQHVEYTRRNRPGARKSIKGRLLPVMASVGLANARQQPAHHRSEPSNSAKGFKHSPPLPGSSQRSPAPTVFSPTTPYLSSPSWTPTPAAVSPGATDSCINPELVAFAKGA